MDAPSLTAALRRKALELGFDLAEAAPIPSDGLDISHLEEWLDQGSAGEMRFFADRLDAYRDPNRVLAGVKSVLMLGTNYRTVEPIEPQMGQGKISRYAWGEDYHDVIHERLRRLDEFFRQLVPGGNARGIVDTAPFLERAHAARAGLGWIGKNTLLINRRFGSWIFLAALLTTEELECPRIEEENNPCGACRACLDACPTGALVAPYQLDARRCLSYLTVELRGDVPAEIKSKLSGRLFGCDACQEACPWNRRTPATAEKAFFPRKGANPAVLAEIENLDEASFRRRFRGTPLWRIKLDGMLRNAAIVQENSKSNSNKMD